MSPERAVVGRLNIQSFRASAVPCRPLASEERGVALVTALLIMGILLLLGTAFLTISSTETQIAINERNAVQAFFLAEAGVNKAISQLNADSEYPGETDTSLGPGTFTVKVTAGAGSNQKVIEAIGYVPNSTSSTRTLRTVKLTVERSSVFRYGLFARRDVKIDRTGIVDSYDSSLGPYGGSNIGSHGTIGSNDDVELGEQVQVNGGVTAADTIEKHHRVTITGTETEGASLVELPQVTVPRGFGLDVTVEDGGSQSLVPGSYGKLRVGTNGTISLSPGTYYFYGDVKFQDHSELTISPRGRVTIHVTGMVTGRREVRINAAPSARPTDLIIYSSVIEPDEEDDGGEGERDIKFGNNVKFFGAIYAPGSKILVKELGSSADPTLGIYGSLVAREIRIHKRQRVHRDTALTRVTTSLGSFKPVAGTWRELIPSR